ncbi:MAG: methylthioribulose 1-phosphate dehydratase [Bacteroidota bacterium]
MNQLKEDLAQTIRAYHAKGWSPATSTNYSFREEGEIFVSRSGIDKSAFSAHDFIVVDQHGIPAEAYKEIKPSAETLIHCVLYRLFPATGVILHAHSVYSVLNSQKYEEELIFGGYEIQKGFKGQHTHLGQVSIPILENTQDMEEFSRWMEARKAAFSNHCFIIRNHGTYAWGETLFEAKRHLETLEYLLEINWKLNH